MVAGATVAPLSGAAVVNDVTNEPQKRASDNRRSNKPIMEKRRRARINNCLNELKTLILDAMKKDPARHSKLEKADILEMTVRHLESLQRQQTALATAADPGVMNKFRAGYAQCCGEVSRFPGLEPAVRRRLMQHLAGCLVNATNGNANRKSPTTVQDETPESNQNQVHILPAPEPAQQIHLSAHAGGSVFVTTSGGQGVQLLPTRLPNGDIALVLPASKVPQQQTPTPQMVPQVNPQPTANSSPSSSPNTRLIPNLAQLHPSMQTPNVTHQVYAEQHAASPNGMHMNQRLSPNVIQQQNVVMVNQYQNVVKQNLTVPQATSVIVPTLLTVPQRTSSTHSASSGSCSPASFCYVSPPTPPKSSHSGETPDRSTFSPEINNHESRVAFQKQCTPDIDVEERLNQLNRVADGLQGASGEMHREHKRPRHHLLQRPESPQGPISLVVRKQKTYKAAEDETNPCWRPW